MNRDEKTRSSNLVVRNRKSSKKQRVEHPVGRIFDRGIREMQKLSAPKWKKVFGGEARWKRRHVASFFGREATNEGNHGSGQFGEGYRRHVNPLYTAPKWAKLKS